MMIEPTRPTDTSAIQPGSPSPAAPAESKAETPAARALPAWLPSFDFLLFALLLVLGFLLASFAATNADLWMHLAVGKLVREGEYQFGVDPFSWASNGAYWVNHSWLSSLLFYVVYQSLGGGALVIGKAILFTAALALLCRIAWSPTTRWYVVLCVTMAALAASGRLFMNPLIFSFFLLAVTLFVLDRAGLFALDAGPERRTKALWCLPPIFALWANLDGWFILGPLVVGLCWAGVGLMRWRGHPSTVTGRELGLVFIAGLLACVLNPHHVRVFQLPTELAYLLVRVGDAVKLPLPDAIFANGRTLRIVQQVDPTFVLDRAGLSAEYWTRSELGMNIAGLAAAPLFLLGLLSFLLVALIRPQPPAAPADGPAIDGHVANAPRLHFVRLLLWVLFALLALSLARLIPLFAFVAAPFTAMTLGEFLNWQQAQSEAPSSQDRSLRLVRLVTLPFLLILITFAWPGWLHAPVGDTNAVHRVAWEVRPDASVRRVAEELNSLQEGHEVQNVFNIGLELPAYCAWFAPRVRWSFDSRYALFVDQAATYTRARLALLDNEKPAGDWQDFLEKHLVRQVIHSRLDSRKGPVFLLDSEHWLPRYVNGSVFYQEKGRAQVQLRAGVFTLNKEGWPKDAQMAQWNRQAFGPVPENERPPYTGTLLPETLSEWDLFVQGTGPVPATVYETQVLDQFFKIHAQFENARTQQRRPLMAVKMLASISPLSESYLTVLPAMVPFLLEDVRPPDLGPPALPVLMMRAARQAVAENPHEIGSYGALMNAQDALYESQDYWIRRAGRGQTPVMRDRIREAQRVATAYSVAQLQPSNARAQRMLAEIYTQHSLVDLALDRFRAAQTALETRKPDLNELKELQNIISAVERSVRMRQTKLQEKLPGKSPLEQADFAFRTGTFLDFHGDKPIEQPLALGKKAFEILAGVRRDTLKPNEVVYYWQLQFDLALAMGHVNELALLLRQEEFRKSVPPAFLARYQTLVGGVLGDYAMLDEGLRQLESAHRELIEPQRKLLPTTLAALFDPCLTIPAASTWPIRLSVGLGRAEMIRSQNNELFSVMAERGIAALEAGQTEKAHDLLAATLSEAGATSFFSERPVAQRYLELLKQQKGPSPHP